MKVDLWKKAFILIQFTYWKLEGEEVKWGGLLGGGSGVGVGEGSGVLDGQDAFTGVGPG